ncbi:MAG: hypothetical protein AABZ60_04680 [Planctomycetota bacterium]
MATLKGKIETLSLPIGDLLLSEVPVVKTGEKTYLIRAGEYLDTTMFRPFLGKEVELEGSEDAFCRRHAPLLQLIFRVDRDENGDLKVKTGL